ncbi:MAG: hypothetical protein OXH31_05965 [Gammaproteobacteria bacterium]|nr:hypothetical protein [Gammaproteobacteria bacterium]
MRFISTTLVLSLLAISLSTNTREGTIVGGFNYLDTDTTQTSSTGDTVGTSSALDTVSSGSRTIFSAFIQSFEDAGFQRILQINFPIDRSFAYPITQDVTGLGFRFVSGWTL